MSVLLLCLVIAPFSFLVCCILCCCIKKAGQAPQEPQPVPPEPAKIQFALANITYSPRPRPRPQPDHLQVQNLSAQSNTTNGSIEVHWSHPIPHCDVHVSKYKVSYVMTSCSLNGTRPRHKYIQIRNSCTLSHKKDGIEPLNTYRIEVLPVFSSDRYKAMCKSTTIYAGWDCKYPGCTASRRKRKNSYSAFCSGLHAKRFNSEYCLFPECTVKANVEHFCTSHYREATTQGMCGLVELDSGCKEYKNLESNFSKKWCLKKGRLPKIQNVLKIVNPSIEYRLDNYVNSLPRSYQNFEQYYHGTQLKCDMLDFFEPCGSTSCGVCGITRKGFDPNRIRSESWQRFGMGFYFACNSSKSYEYPLAGRKNHSDDKHHCVLVCDIAPGRKYTLYENDPSLKGPPSGYHSVYGQSTWLWFWKSPDINYDELVIFDADAIRPRYILFCENTKQN